MQSTLTADEKRLYDYINRNFAKEIQEAKECWGFDRLMYLARQKYPFGTDPEMEDNVKILFKQDCVPTRILEQGYY
jgi:hypothetical protein